ncbi:MAG TPA: hypothetical protein PLP29_14170 [Candidatus Ozemobacteraceae bacterium]|nr:hypothetical protein [Candidatus Ozemobacteraceae bacterium]
MGSELKPAKTRWLLLVALALSSLVITGCEKGSLGVKSGTVEGYVLESTKYTPVADVLLRATNAKYGTRSVNTGGDGRYVLTDMNPDEGDWTLEATKYGYFVDKASGTSEAGTVVVKVTNGETVQAPTILMGKSTTSERGTLRGYPIDAVIGKPVQNFTVTQIDPARTKTFETSQDFKESGWTSLEGGERTYKINCDNYDVHTIGPIQLTKSGYDLGVIQLNPLRVSISGTLRNVPGYIYGNGADANFTGVIWAESAGRVVATGTAGTGGGTFQGTVVYTLPNIPITAGTVAVKMKIRGYDTITINSSVSLPSQRPGGTIGGIDIDFNNIEPIKRDLRVVVRGKAPSGQEASTLENGETVRVYIKQGGKDLVPYVDVVGSNYMAEAYFSGVITGYEIDILAVNLTRGYIKGEETGLKVSEDSSSIFTTELQLEQ